MADSRGTRARGDWPSWPSTRPCSQQTRLTELPRSGFSLREDRANRTIWSFAAAKALAVALNPIPAADVLGGSAVDVSMVVTLAHIYGLEMSWVHARKLLTSIGKAAGWITAAVLAEWTINVLAGTLKAATLGTGTAITAVPQGAVAGVRIVYRRPGRKVLLRTRCLVGQ